MSIADRMYIPFFEVGDIVPSPGPDTKDCLILKIEENDAFPGKPLVTCMHEDWAITRTGVPAYVWAALVRGDPRLNDS